MRNMKKIWCPLQIYDFCPFHIYIYLSWSGLIKQLTQGSIRFQKTNILRKSYFCSPQTISRKHGLHCSKFSEVKICYCKLVITSLCMNSERTTTTKNAYQLFSFSSFITALKIDIVNLNITILCVAFVFLIYVITWPVNPDATSSGVVPKTHDTQTLHFLIASTATVYTLQPSDQICKLAFQFTQTHLQKSNRTLALMPNR